MAVLARVVRSGVVECEHHGSAVVVGADGTVEHQWGEPQRAMMPRSSNKPLQLVGMLRCGLRLPPPLLAIATASHAGEAMHVARVERLLTAAGLSVDQLRCPAAMPGDDDAARQRWCAGLGPEPVFMNCSGKHAAMLATCRHNHWSLDSYLDADHPLQQALRDAVVDLAGEPVDSVAVDGCGAPIFSISLVGLAGAFGRMVRAAPDSPERAVVEACRAYPLLVSGTHRPDGQLAAGVPGLFAKAGAEGVFAAALPDGRAIAVRTHDGAMRATLVVMAELLHCLGVRTEVVEAMRTSEVTGGDRRVGSVEAVL